MEKNKFPPALPASSASPSWPPAPGRCRHDGQDVVLTVGKVTFGGGAGANLWITPRPLIVIDFAGDAGWVEARAAFPEALAVLQEHVVSCPRASVPWADFGLPPVTRGFWLALPEAVSSNYGPGHVILCCGQGHGRTGTALAALAIVHKGLSAAAAISMVRTTYCNSAVETRDQVQYLCDLAGKGEVVEHADLDAQGKGKGEGKGRGLYDDPFGYSDFDVRRGR